MANAPRPGSSRPPRSPKPGARGAKPSSRPGSKPGPRSGSRSGSGRSAGPARSGPGRDRRSRTADGPAPEVEPTRAGPQRWGGVARRGAGRLAAGQPSGSASAAFRQAVDQARTGPPRAPEPSAEWVRVDDVRDEASGAVRRGRAPTRAARPGPAPAADELADQLRKGVPAAERDKVSRRLDDAARLFAAERYAEAARILRSVTERAPGLAPARELYGLVLYRQGRWKVAAAELEAFRALTGSTEQHPVLADCYRALRRWSLVEELWDELRVASPGAELVTEGRIVAAGALADQGDLPRAIRLLGADWRFPKRAAEHHLRRAYALADLEERAGDLPRARELFGRVHGVDPGFADVASRLRALR